MNAVKKQVYLLGYPLGHSVSPAMQNAAFRALNIDWEYSKLEFPREKLGEVVVRLRQDDCMGANVTIPYKQAVIHWLDELSDTARRINAVNTIINRGGKLIGDNTDAFAFISSVNENHIHPRNARGAILGAGGAACAAAFAIAEEGAREIIIVNRSGARAADLADHLHANFPKLEIATNWFDAMADVHILVNATPIGTYPNVDESPMPRGLGYSPHTIVVDLVYNPIETKFLSDAKRVGARTIGGLGMLVHQGAAAFKLWTGKEAPIEIMRKAAHAGLRNEHALADR